MIEIDSLTKHYNQGRNVVRALDGVTLGIEQGEFVAVVGRSGSGKTTMLDSLGLLLTPTSGRVVIDGVDTSRMKDNVKARLRGEKIGFIFQEYNLLPTLTALENVMLPLRYASKPKGDRVWAQSLMAEVGLEDRMHHRPDQMSGGQQQRVAIARSLVNRPSLVLGD
ncbi:MAG TPA: ABC transporter ATP-binding protein, partial [Candidatus Udaeobacter sp.]|nr:ABC transporter ATP-binding protein [Candidatus Udaeobacter sp.]